MGLIFRLFGMFATGNFRALFATALGLCLVGGLWETSLVNLSSHTTATSVLTEVGVEVINPVLTNNSFGVSQSVYAAAQQSARAHPSQPISIPGIKVQVLGSDILGKSFNDGTRVIYQKVAEAYYTGGPGAVFNVPSNISSAISALALLPQAVESQGAKAVGVPQLPSVPLPPLGAIGLSPQLLTVHGHSQVQTLDYWLLGAALLFAALVALTSPRWRRLSNVCWSLISAAIPGVLGIGIIWFFWNRDPAPFQAYAGLLDALGSAFVPVYGGAVAVGVVGLVVAFAGDALLKAARAGRQVAPARAGQASFSPARRGAGDAPWDQPAPGAARPEYRRPPLPGSAYPQYGEQSPYAPHPYAPLEPTAPYPPYGGQPAGQRPGEAQWGEQQPAAGWQPQQGPGAGYGEQAYPEPTWPGQAPAQPPAQRPQQPQRPQRPQQRPGAGGQGWPPQGDDDPWAPRGR
jgi:hypothetical protein